MLQHYAHPRNGPTTTDEKKTSLLYFGCDFSAVGTISEKSLKLPPRHILKLKCTKFDLGAGYSASPVGLPLAGFKGPTSKGKERKGKGLRGAWGGSRHNLARSLV